MPDYTKPDFKNLALITIDMQQDVLRGSPFEISGTSEVIPAIQRLTTAFRDTRRPIVHVVRLYKPDGSNVDLCRRESVEKGMALVCPGRSGSEIASDLVPPGSPRLDPDLLLSSGIQSLRPKEWAMYKPRWGAFYKTPLEQHLKELGASSLVFTGCNFPNCPRTSTYEASERDFRIVLVEDAVSGLYERGRAEMTNIGVEVMTAEEVVQACRTA